jgi:hypothetical protein
MTEAEVLSRVSGLPTHINAEYPWLGNLYQRSDVDSLAPFSSVKISDNARTCSAYEPDYFHH